MANNYSLLMLYIGDKYMWWHHVLYKPQNKLTVKAVPIYGT